MLFVIASGLSNKGKFIWTVTAKRDVISRQRATGDKWIFVGFPRFGAGRVERSQGKLFRFFGVFHREAVALRDSSVKFCAGPA